jgi:NADH:ubiquinone oxidoreductase subunit H
MMCAMTTILFLGGWLPPDRRIGPLNLAAGRHLVRLHHQARSCSSCSRW